MTLLEWKAEYHTVHRIQRIMAKDYTDALEQAKAFANAGETVKVWIVKHEVMEKEPK